MAANRLQRDDDRHLNLDQQKTRAKELLRAARRAEAEALERLRKHHPRAADVIGDAYKLSDAQLVIARELGVASWPKLKAHVEALDRARDAIAAKGPAPDRDIPTVHIRCGSDIRQPLKDAGFVGNFLEFSDPLWMGPLPEGPDKIAERARRIGEAAEMAPAAVAEKLRREYGALAEIADRYGRAVMWCEYDPYDQLSLARVLAEFAGRKPLPRVELIAVDGFPTIGRFVGLGQLSAAALRSLWDGRLTVNARLLTLGAAVWDALRDPSPAALGAIAAGGTPELPMMAAALTRHLQELPATTNGLSLTQQAALSALRDKPQTVSQLFWSLSSQPFMGDLFFWATLRDMQRVDPPPLAVAADTASQRWPQRLISLTETGLRLLDGGLDWMRLKPPERWVGGVRVAGEAPAWRWDTARSVPVRV